TMAPSRPEAVPKRLAPRASAKPPRTTPTTASTATAIAQSRRKVRPYTVVAAGSETGAATRPACTRPTKRPAAARAARTRAKARFIVIPSLHLVTFGWGHSSGVWRSRGRERNLGEQSWLTERFEQNRPRLRG